MNRCTIHREYRHPRICRLCRASEEVLPLAPSEKTGQASLGLEAVTAVPPAKPRVVAQEWRRVEETVRAAK